MPLTPDLAGQTEEGSVTVAPEHYASVVLPGAPDVFSTPSLGALVEKTAGTWLARQIEPGQMSVGAQLLINHTAATPPGLTVTVEVTVTAIDGRKVDYTWTASDGVDTVGNGTHQRFVVDSERFMSRLASKRPS